MWHFISLESKLFDLGYVQIEPANVYTIVSSIIKLGWLLGLWAFWSFFLLFIQQMIQLLLIIHPNDCMIRARLPLGQREPVGLWYSWINKTDYLILVFFTPSNIILCHHHCDLLYIVLWFKITIPRWIVYYVSSIFGL